jgi:methylenetetrahydrofolate dehydrogenase (NADP+)/methenyltetrahydrofolate cyclohydrolase
MAEARIIDGKAFAEGLRGRVATAVADLKRDHGLVPGLAAVLVGDNPASRVYVGNKAKQTVAAGMQSFEHRLPEDTSQADLLALVDQLNADPQVHGILVQLPLPAQIDSDTVLAAVTPDKDVDGFHAVNTGKLWTLWPRDAPLVPCTPLGCLMLLRDEYARRGAKLEGERALIVGRSNIVGKPMAALLLAESCTVTVAHSRTRDLPGTCREADILVAAVGRPEMVRGDWVKPGATVIDVGINRIDAGEGKTRLVGDVAFAEAAAHAAAITPVPGGVGPMTIACLLRNTVAAACAQNGVAIPEI